uniref:Protein kinase domain-containing protein n=1 Tax=Peronospora matthiolae TaxID=2874970 RepID=A0AAV1T1A4_9STRA
MAAKLDDYVIQRRLAPALFGDVLLCQHKPSGDLVAVKRVLQSAARAQRTLASNKKVHENVALERALCRELQRAGGHENVLALRDEMEIDGYVYLVSDFCARGELYELVSAADTGHLPVALVQKYGRQIARGVSFLHAHGFAHRDLSLENVLVTDDDQCQVCDFGLAASTAQRSRETVGKLFYMAPEVLAAVPYRAAKADVWSLGVMLFIMLVGAPPVETASSMDARFRLITNKGVRQLLDRWGLTQDLPAAAVDLLAAMLEVDPEQRISMDQVVAHPFLRSASSSSSGAVVAPLQQVEALEGQQIRTSLPVKCAPQQPVTPLSSSVPVTSMYVTRPESDGIARGSCRLLFHKIHRFFSRRRNKRVMAVNRSQPVSSTRAVVKRLVCGA